MKYIEVTKKEAQDIVRSGCCASVCVFVMDCVGSGSRFSFEYTIDPTDYNQPEYFSMDGFLTSIIAELSDNLHYTFKFFEVWN